MTHIEWDDGHRRLDDGTSIGVRQAVLMLEILEWSPSSLDVSSGDLNSEPGTQCLTRLRAAGFRPVVEAVVTATN